MNHVRVWTFKINMIVGEGYRSGDVEGGSSWLTRTATTKKIESLHHGCGQ